MSSQFTNGQTLQNVMITKIDHCNDNFLTLTSALNSVGVSKYNCTPNVVFDSTKTTVGFNDASSQAITSWIANTERIYFNGLRTTAYTANSSGGKIVFTIAPSSMDKCIADFDVLGSITTTQMWDVSMSSSDYTEFTSTGIITIIPTGWSTWSDTGWLPTT